MIFIILTIAFASSYMLSAMGAYMLSAFTLIAAAFYFYAYYYHRCKNILCPAALFSLSWLLGAGISCMKLSKLQTDWETETWICIYLAELCFIGAYELCYKLIPLIRRGKASEKNVSKKEEILSSERDIKKVREEGAVSDTVLCKRQGLRKLYAIRLVCYIVTLLYLSAFIFEAVNLGYIPLFTVDTPHAYSYFHISGVHYFTTAFVLVPSVCAVYFETLRADHCCEKKASIISMLICLLLSLILPILLISRFQLIFSVALMAITIISIERPSLGAVFKKKNMPFILGGFAAIIALYVILTVARAHSIEYLKSIFEMKNDKLPIALIQPYMYVANNFDNLNCLIRDLPKHTEGLRMLFPLFVFTGIKFTHPELTYSPIYVTKEELTTLTLVYDAYYDFGLLGVAGFCFILGIVFAALELYLASRRGHESDHPDLLIYVTSSQLIFYIMFSFFTTWFSNPSTWFYLIGSLSAYAFSVIYVKVFKRKDSR